MKEDWSAISAEKLAKLFPILLSSHNPAWKEEFIREKQYLLSVFGNAVARISHIGSTAVVGLLAKPTVDILLEISEQTDLPAITARLENEGYVVNHAKQDILTLIKGYTTHGFEGQAMHIHIRYRGDWGELYFRDYLNIHPDVAREYETLKKHLKEKYTFDRDGYTEAKGSFIHEHTKRARKEFPNRYTPQ